MVFKGFIKSFKEERAEKKEAKAALKKELKSIGKAALKASLKERRAASIRIAKKEILLKEERRERILRQKLSRDPVSLGSIAKGAAKVVFGPSKQPTARRATPTRTPTKKKAAKKRTTLEQDLMSGGLA